MEGQHYSLGKVPDGYTPAQNPAQNILTQPCSIIWKCFYSLCLSQSALKTQSVASGTLSFPHGTPESSAEPRCLSFSLTVCSSLRSWKEPCQFLLHAAQWPSGDTLADELFVCLFLIKKKKYSVHKIKNNVKSR